LVDLRDPTYCKRHPQTESYLGCSRCGDLICSQCLVQTPVGARCPEHGESLRNPMTQTSNSEMTRAIMVGVGTSLGLHLLYAVMYLTLGALGTILAIFAPMAIGYFVGEAVYRSSGYTRNKNLAWVAAGSVLGGFVMMALLFPGVAIGIFGVLIGGYVAYTRVRP